MNKALITTLVLLGVASVYLYSLENQTSEVYSFEQFKGDFGKRYFKEGEEQYRKNIFLRNLIKIQEHNANPANTYTMGVNQFSDLTQAEFEAIYLTLQVPKRTYKTVETEITTSNEGDIDWQAAGKVTAVKNQGGCGSCWAFSATAAQESAILLETGETVSLSEQQLVDCSRSYGNQGCNGGWMDSAFEYVMDHGLTTTSAYPYVARDQACKIDMGDFKIKKYVDVKGCNDLLNSLSDRPVSVAVDASVWSAYRSGVLNNCAKNVNHGVLLVGATDAYWRIKNSWGASWGESGFIRISRGDTCAICQYPSYPKVK